ncbi:MAG: translation initiation factor IF-2 [Candidatus Micrarchaeaceae archaeon]
MIRQPIIVVMGHVDHGKTTLLDKIRNSAIAAKEAGGITQHIGASEVPISAIEKISGSLLKKMPVKLTIPGLLFIDTPGHEAFTNLRKRGGSIADLAILVVDVSKGFEPQTYEAIDILKAYKTPFVVAANKIDLITGWRNSSSASFDEAIRAQNQQVQSQLDSLIYSLVGRLSELGFNSERYDRVKNFQKEISIIPISAKTGEGIAELLVYVAGLSQRFLEARLNIETSGPASGSILEKKEEVGLGTTVDAIIYNGTLKVNDIVAFATEHGVGTAKVKALLKARPMYEMRLSSGKFYSVESVTAAAGVKISGNGFEEALPGSPLVSIEVPNYADDISAEISEVFATDKTGVILKTDTIGTMEAISKLLKNAGVRISKKGLGNVSKRDVLDAFAMKGIDPFSAVVLSFNVKIDDDAKLESEASGTKIISENIIYKIVDDYKEWLEAEKGKEMDAAEKALTFPGMLKVLPNMCFRISHPAIFGVDVLAGRIKPSYLLMKKTGTVVGRIREIQNNGISFKEAKKGDSVAISIDDVTFGRHIKEEDVLYTFVSDSDYMLLRGKFSGMLSDDERDLLEEIKQISSIKPK